VAGLMERLGLEEDMAIESRLVSRTIESAQSRVEGYNFDIRKRVVEYDDVINKQRETIYEERDKVLRNEDLTDTVQDFVDQEIDSIVDRFLPPTAAASDWNMAGLVGAIEAMGLGGPEVTEDSLWDLRSGEAIALHLKDMAAERLEQKDEENSEEWALIERLVLLRTIDSIWVEHLTEIDEMRQGIGLRGFAQEDPLNAYKKEAFALYEEMSALIRHQVATTIFRVSIVRQPAPPVGVEGTGQAPAGGPAAAAPDGRPAGTGGRPLPKGLPQGRPMGGAGGASSQAAGGPIRPGYSPAGVRMGRNDQCWCGSGKKYKKCHGR
jgi:preprotein translocase subunit SecA